MHKPQVPRAQPGLSERGHALCQGGLETPGGQLRTLDTTQNCGHKQGREAPARQARAEGRLRPQKQPHVVARV